MKTDKQQTTKKDKYNKNGMREGSMAYRKQCKSDEVRRERWSIYNKKPRNKTTEYATKGRTGYNN